MKSNLKYTYIGVKRLSGAILLQALCDIENGYPTEEMATFIQSPIGQNVAEILGLDPTSLTEKIDKRNFNFEYNRSIYR